MANPFADEFDNILKNLGSVEKKEPGTSAKKKEKVESEDEGWKVKKKKAKVEEKDLGNVLGGEGLSPVGKAAKKLQKKQRRAKMEQKELERAGEDVPYAEVSEAGEGLPAMEESAKKRKKKQKRAKMEQKELESAGEDVQKELESAGEDVPYAEVSEAGERLPAMEESAKKRKKKQKRAKMEQKELESAGEDIQKELESAGEDIQKELESAGEDVPYAEVSEAGERLPAMEESAKKRKKKQKRAQMEQKELESAGADVPYAEVSEAGERLPAMEESVKKRKKKQKRAKMEQKELEVSEAGERLPAMEESAKKRKKKQKRAKMERKELESAGEDVPYAEVSEAGERLPAMEESVKKRKKKQKRAKMEQKELESAGEDVQKELESAGEDVPYAEMSEAGEGLPAMEESAKKRKKKQKRAQMEQKELESAGEDVQKELESAGEDVPYAEVSEAGERLPAMEKSAKKRKKKQKRAQIEQKELESAGADVPYAEVSEAGERLPAMEESAKKRKKKQKRAKMEQKELEVSEAGERLPAMEKSAKKRKKKQKRAKMEQKELESAGEDVPYAEVSETGERLPAMEESAKKRKKKQKRAKMEQKELESAGEDVQKELESAGEDVPYAEMSEAGEGLPAMEESAKKRKKKQKRAQMEQKELESAGEDVQKELESAGEDVPYAEVSEAGEGLPGMEESANKRKKKQKRAQMEQKELESAGEDVQKELESAGEDVPYAEVSEAGEGLLAMEESAKKRKKKQKRAQMEQKELESAGEDVQKELESAGEDVPYAEVSEAGEGLPATEISAKGHLREDLGFVSPTKAETTEPMECLRRRRRLEQRKILDLIAKARSAPDSDDDKSSIPKDQFHEGTVTQETIIDAPPATQVEESVERPGQMQVKAIIHRVDEPSSSPSQDPPCRPENPLIVEMFGHSGDEIVSGSEEVSPRQFQTPLRLKPRQKTVRKKKRRQLTLDDLPVRGSPVKTREARNPPLSPSLFEEEIHSSGDEFRLTQGDIAEAVEELQESSSGEEDADEKEVVKEKAEKGGKVVRKRRPPMGPVIRARSRTGSEDTKKLKRNTCPECGLAVIRLKRHYDAVHPGVRYERPQREIKPRVYPKYKCPVEGCRTGTQRLDIHLIRCHKLRRGSEAFTDAMASPEEYTPEEKERSDLDNMLEDYVKHHLTDRASGLGRNEKTVLSHTSGIKKFLTRLTKQAVLDLENLGKAGGVVDKYLQSKEIQANSLKTYLASTAGLLEWLSGSRKWLRHLDLTAASILTIQGAVKNVAKSLRGDIMKRQVERVCTGEADVPLTPAMIGGYLSSKRHERAKDVILASQTRKLNKTERLEARNVLVTQMLLLNFKRNGDIPHLTKEEVKTAKVEEEDDEVELKIYQHKEARSGKVCSLFVSTELLNLLQLFAKNICWAVPSCPFLFTAQNGKELTSSTTSKLVKREWASYKEEAKLPELPDLTANMVRKVAATTAREEGRSRADQECLAAHMAHSLSTADKHYDKAKRVEGRKQVVKGVRQTFITAAKAKQTKEVSESSSSESPSKDETEGESD